MRLLALVFLGGCLWISPSDLADQKAKAEAAQRGSLAFELDPPGTLSRCATPALVIVDGTVGAGWAGEEFQVWFQPEGFPRVDAAGTVKAGPASGDGAPLSITIVEAAISGPADACDGPCDVGLTVGIDHPDASGSVDTTVHVLPESTPTLAESALLDASSVATAIGSAARDPDDDGIDVVDYPFLVAGVDDPNVSLATASWLACRDDAASIDPSDPGCVSLPATASTDVAGDGAWKLDTGELAALTCAAGDLGARYSVSLAFSGHPCGDVGPILVAPADRWLGRDCDGDGSDRGTDCADLDPTRSPELVDVCGDSFDADCSGVDGHGDAALVIGATTTEYADLQAAIDDGKGNAGAEIRLCGGTWQGPFQIDDDLAITGWDGQIATLEGDGTAPVVKVNGGAEQLGEPDVDTVALSNLLIEGGGGGNGGGLDGKSSSLAISGCEFTGNTSTGLGGGILVGGVATLTDLDVHDNTAQDGGGLALVGGTITLDAVDVHDNTANGTGGGVLVRDATVDATGSTVSGNGAPAGAGATVDWQMGPPGATQMDVTGLVIDANDGLGSGLEISQDGGTILVHDTTVSGHVAGDGGGVHVTGASGETTLDGLTITGNTGQRGGGVFSDFGGTLTIEGGSITSNTALDRGGGVFVGGGTVVLQGMADVTTNNAPTGGGVALNAGSLELRATAITGNQATTQGCSVSCLAGGALFVDGGTAWFYGDIVQNNSVVGAWPGVGVRVAGAGELDTCGTTRSIDQEVANDAGAVPSIASGTCTVTTASADLARVVACGCPP